jgi:hypothetical protein
MNIWPANNNIIQNPQQKEQEYPKHTLDELQLL